MNKYILKAENICKNFGGLKALNGVSFEVKYNEILGIIGPNGAGKTTLFNVITAFLNANKGKITFVDQDITQLSPHKISRLGLIRTFQLGKLFESLTVKENVIIGSLLHTNNITNATQKALKILCNFGLENRAEEKIKNLPVGLRKLVELSRALAAEPKILLLDEPMAGLNSTESKHVTKVISNLPSFGVTVLIIEHALAAILPILDRVIVLNKGEKLIEGKPQEVVKNAEIIKAYLGEGFSFVKD